jgi:hypothetical protein
MTLETASGKSLIFGHVLYTFAFLSTWTPSRPSYQSLPHGIPSLPPWPLPFWRNTPWVVRRTCLWQFFSATFIETRTNGCDLFGPPMSRNTNLSILNDKRFFQISDTYELNYIKRALYLRLFARRTSDSEPSSN